MKNPAASTGYERRDENSSQGVTPECFYQGSSFGFGCGERVEPRLKQSMRE